MDKVLEFSYNWNNKLNCKFFTTLRLSDKYKVGEIYPIKLKGRDYCQGKILTSKRFLVSEINNFIAFLDTGYNPKECREILKRMYKHKAVNWKTQRISLYLIERHELTLNFDGDENST